MCSKLIRCAFAVLLAVVVGACETSALRDSGAVEGVLFEAAATAEQSANYRAAANHYEKLYRQRPGNVTVLFALVRNLRYSGASGRAIRLLQSEQAAHGKSAAFQLELGKARLAAGDTVGGLANLKSSIEKDAENWEAHSTLGIALDIQDDFDGARRAYERALALSPSNPAVLNNMAISRALSGDLAGAISILKNAPRVARHSPQIRQNLALFYGIQGDVVSAEALGRIDLSDETVKQNMQIYSQLRGN